MQDSGDSGRIAAVSIRERDESFRKRWGIEYDPKQTFDEFKNRVAHALGSCVPDLHSILLRFGEPAHRKLIAIFGAQQVGFSINERIQKAVDWRELATVLQRIFWATGDSGDQKAVAGGLAFRQNLREAIEYSPAAGLEMVDDGTGAVFYPAGAGLLDEGVVNPLLVWMEDCPIARKHFTRALELYLAGDPERFRNLLDELRLAIEELVRVALGNDKSLENQKEPLLQWLRDRGLHPQVVNMYHRLLFGEFATYQNEAVKHREAWGPEEVEYMIYLTGTFARLLLRLRQKDRR